MTEKKKINTVCQDGICPLCGGQLHKHDEDPDTNTLAWTCKECNAYGGSSYKSHFTVFEGHYDVFDSEDNEIEIREQPATKEAEACKMPQMPGCCPLCGGMLDILGAKQIPEDGHAASWVCQRCGATGEERYIYQFAGQSNVKTRAGIPVDLGDPMPLVQEVAITEGTDSKLYAVMDVCDREAGHCHVAVGLDNAVILANEMLKEHIKALGENYLEEFEDGEGQHCDWEYATAYNRNGWCNWSSFQFDVFISQLEVPPYG